MANKSQLKTCIINGKKVTYWQQNTSSSVTLVLIHGFRGTHHGLLKIAESLPNYNLVIPDLPGFGQSQPLDTEHSIDNYVEWLNEFIDKVSKKQPITLVGHSFGSIITSYYASLYPYQISKLILINPIGAPALTGSHKILGNLVNLFYILGSHTPESFARKIISLKPIVKATSIVLRTTKDRRLKRYIDNQHYAHFSSFANKQQLYEAYVASVSHDISQVASKIGTRTLLIIGQKDQITPLDKQFKLSKLFKNADFKVIKDVGHLSHYETPQEVAEHIKNFIK